MNKPQRGSNFIFVDKKLCKTGGVEIALFTNKLPFLKIIFLIYLQLLAYLSLKNLCLNVEILHEADAQQSPAVHKEKQMEGLKKL